MVKRLRRLSEREDAILDFLISLMNDNAPVEVRLTEIMDHIHGEFYDGSRKSVISTMNGLVRKMQDYGFDIRKGDQRGRGNETVYYLGGAKQ